MSDSLAWRLCSYTLAVALAMSALGAGAIHLPLLLAYGSLVAGAGVLAARARSRSAMASRRPELLALLLGLALAVYSLLQALPLPLGWLQAIAPQTAQIWTSSFDLLEPARPDVASLSLAPRRTVQEALEVASYGVVFAVSAGLSRELGVHRILGLGFGLALAVALVTAAHQVVGAERLYGIYEPIDAYSVAPLLNSNNRAGYLNLGFFCGLGLLFRTGLRPHAALFGLGLAFVAAEILLCASVGGTASLALGALLVLVLPRPADSTRGGPNVGRPLQAAIVFGIGIGATLLALAFRRSQLGLNDRSLEKLELFSKTLRVIGDHPWFGVGRGAFGSVFASYQDLGSHVVSEHVENLVLQWAAEWGIPVAALAVLALGCLLLALARRRTLGSSTRRCALVGCAVLLLQNMVDLGLEIPAVSALLFCVLGGLAGAARGASHDAPAAADPQPLRWNSALHWAGPALCGACWVIAAIWGVESTGRLRHDLHAQLSSERRPSPEFWASLRRAIRAYPAEPYFPLLGSSAALAAGQNPLPWISRALQRNPTSAQAHLQLARILHAYHRSSQAIVALRRAVELDPRHTHSVFQLGKQWGLSERELERAAPDGAAGVPLILMLAGRAEDPAARQRLLEQALERDPHNTDAHHRLASELLRQLSARLPSTPCKDQRETCLARAEEHARLSDEPNTSRSGILQARVLMARGQPALAEAHLASVCERLPADAACIDALVSLALENGSARAEGAVKRLVALACRNRERCASTHLTLGHRFAAAGDWGLAMGHYRRAAEENPAPETLVALARAAERLGQRGLASDARRRAQLLESSARAATDEPQEVETVESPRDHLLPPGAPPLPTEAASQRDAPH